MPFRPITSLIYVSTATPGLEPEDLMAIMSVSRRNNAQSGLTGLLLYNGFNFMQCIEGEKALANECLYRIGMDERHSGMTVVGELQLARAQFPQWSMAGVLLSVQPDIASGKLSEMLSAESVADMTRSLFHNFLSLGSKTLALE